MKGFSLANSVNDMWNAGIYPLALLIAVFSGAWPYVKLVTMLLCWTLPETKLSYKWREKFLIFLDTMGKWSKIIPLNLIFFLFLKLFFSSKKRIFFFSILLNKFIIFLIYSRSYRCLRLGFDDDRLQV